MLAGREQRAVQSAIRRPPGAHLWRGRAALPSSCPHDSGENCWGPHVRARPSSSANRVPNSVQWHAVAFPTVITNPNSNQKTLVRRPGAVDCDASRLRPVTRAFAPALVDGRVASYPDSSQQEGREGGSKREGKQARNTGSVKRARLRGGGLTPAPAGRGQATGCRNGHAVRPVTRRTRFPNRK
jgi:hypothetical protein